MFKGYRNGAFAFGVVVGLGIALNLLLWLDYQSHRQSDQHPQTNDDPNYTYVGETWVRLIDTFVSPSDTLAQWIMAIFTIAATVVLVLTLRSANKTNAAAVKAAQAALEANQIMRDEQRPWVFVDWCFATRDATGNNFVQIVIKNTGKVPAANCRIEWDVRFVSHPESEKPPFRFEMYKSKNFAVFRPDWPFIVNFPVPTETYDEMLSGDVRIFTGIKITYEFSGRTARTIACYEISAQSTAHVDGRRIGSEYGRCNRAN